MCVGFFYFTSLNLFLKANKINKQRKEHFLYNDDTIIKMNVKTLQPVVKLNRESLESIAEKHGCTIHRVKPKLAGYKIP